MFAEALRALGAYTSEATGLPTRIGRTAVDLAPGREVGSGRTADENAPGVTLALVSVLRTDRFRNESREVGPAAGGSGVAVRRAPGWFDLTVAIETGGDQIAAAEATERLIAATMRTGDLATTLELGGEYPVYASIDTPTIDELQAWLQSGLIQRTGGVLRAVVTVAVQPFEPSRVDIVRTRRIHTDDMRTKVRETVQR